jgi:hypothetical protein
LKFTVGAKETFFESPKVRLFGLMSTGVIRFSAAEIRPPDGRTFIGSRSHLALDLGAGLELFPDRRWSPRLEVVRTFYDVPGASFRAQADPSVILTHDGKIATRPKSALASFITHALEGAGPCSSDRRAG